LLKNASKYFTSYTKLYFLSGVYDLEKWLQINNVTNLTIAGSKATKQALTIQCMPSSTAAFISIDSSMHVMIQNVKIQNCGQYFVNNKSQPISGENAAILLYNVSSMIIADISIQNIMGMA